MKTFARDPKRAALQASPLFEGLPNRHLARMAACFDLAQVAPEVTLLREGVRADALWIIAQGEVELCARGRRLGRVGRGEVLGAAAMFARGGAELTAVAVGPVRVLVASYLQLNQLIADPEVERRLRASAVFSLNQAGSPNLINNALTCSRPPLDWSEIDVGSAFSFRLPAAESPSPGGLILPRQQAGN